MNFVRYKLIREQTLLDRTADNQVNLGYQNGLIIYETYNSGVNNGYCPCYVGSNQNGSIQNRTKPKLQGARELGFWGILSSVTFRFYEVIHFSGELPPFRSLEEAYNPDDYLQKKEGLNVDVEHFLIRWWQYQYNDMELHQQNYVWEEIEINLQDSIQFEHPYLGSLEFQNGARL